MAVAGVESELVTIRCSSVPAELQIFILCVDHLEVYRMSFVNNAIADHQLFFLAFGQVLEHYRLRISFTLK
jgi:hypothetical protein